MTYAGRLDPMAEGELLVLVGEECKNKTRYLNLEKEYEVDILFGFETDSYDILGLSTTRLDLEVGLPSVYDVARHSDKVKRFLKNSKGKQTQKYPPFSSKTVSGKQLFELAKAGNLDGSTLPEKEIEIYDAQLGKTYWLSGRDLKADIFKRILLVRGDFRQDKILEQWNKLLAKRGEEQFLVSKIKVRCSGGTYMRSVAQNLGKFLDIPALAFKITRTKIVE